MSYSLEERVEFLRQSAYVKRMHVNRIVGDYTSHEHVCNMTNMLLLLHPEPTVRLVKLVQWHDSGEFGSGDVPSPAKGFAGFGDANNVVEEAVRQSFGLELEDVTAEEARWVKALDWLELYLFLMDQIHMGNNFMIPILVDFTAFMNTAVDQQVMPKEVETYYVFLLGSGRPTITNGQVMNRIKEECL